MDGIVVLALAPFAVAVLGQIAAVVVAGALAVRLAAAAAVIVAGTWPAPHALPLAVIAAVIAVAAVDVPLTVVALAVAAAGAFLYTLVFLYWLGFVAFLIHSSLCHVKQDNSYLAMNRFEPPKGTPGRAMEQINYKSNRTTRTRHNIGAKLLPH